MENCKTVIRCDNGLISLMFTLFTAAFTIPCQIRFTDRHGPGGLYIYSGTNVCIFILAFPERLWYSENVKATAHKVG